MHSALPTPHSPLPSALILAGGLGTRLRSVVADLPKVLAPVRGRPFLVCLLDQLADAGFRHAVLCTGYRGELVEQAFGTRYRSLALDYSRETTPLGTGGALRLAQRHVRSSSFLAMNGDSYCDADLRAFWAAHIAGRQPGSLLLTEVADTSRYGRVQVAPDGRVQSFKEKGAQLGPGWINAGIYLFDTRLLTSVDDDRPVSLERDLLPRWIDAGLGSFPCRGRFLDIGTPASFAEAERFFGPTAQAG